MIGIEEIFDEYFNRYIILVYGYYIKMVIVFGRRKCWIMVLFLVFIMWFRFYVGFEDIWFLVWLG